MISRYDKNHNRISKLVRSKWTSLEKLNGWKHYEVIEIDKKNDKVELFAVCDRGKRVVVKIKDLKDKAIWKEVGIPKVVRAVENTLSWTSL